MAHEEQDYVDGWHTYSTWIDDIRTKSEILTEYDENCEFRQSLLACKSNHERFKLLWEDDKIHKEIKRIFEADLASISQKRRSQPGKSIEESKRKREMGNKSFKDGKYMDALKHYTQAIRFAPYPSQDLKDESLALAFANRSAALYSLTRYRLCIPDIDLAVKYGYPKSNMFKLMIRKIKCLHILSVWANDVEQIKDDLRVMLQTRDTKEYIKVEIQNMFKFLEQTQPEDMDKDELDGIDETTMKISNSSKTLSQAADCVEMSFDGEKGRYLITNKDVSFGRLLVAEEPYVCNLAPSKLESYCYNCFGKLHACGLGCKNCTKVLYCSESCLLSKANIHSYECNTFIDLQDRIGVAYLVVHIIFKIDFDLTSVPIYTKKNVEKKPLDSVLKIAPCDWPDLVYKNEYSSVLSLMDHAEDYDYDAIIGYSLTSIYLLVAIIDQFSSSRSTLKDKETQLVLGSIILRHLFQLQTNLISILDQNLRGLVSVGHTLSEMQEHPIGVGIYPTVSLLNHSCDPNIFSIFHRNKFIGRASTSLECGTEINYCYGPSVGRMSKRDRQQRLKDQYFFTCTCVCCSTGRENESRALICPDCQGSLIYNLDYSSECLQCKRVNLVDVQSILNRVEDLKFRLNQLDDSSSTQKLQSLEELESSLAKLINWRNPLFVRIKSELITCADELEDSKLALKFCEEELELCARTYGKESYESVMSRLKYINLKWQELYYRIEESEVDEVIETAMQELKILQTTVNETKGKLKDLLASTNIMGAESSFDVELKFLSDIQASISRYLISKEPAVVEDKSKNMP